MRVARGRNNFARDLPGGGVGNIHIDREQRFFRQEHQPAAVGAERGRQIEVAAAAVAADEGLAKRIRRAARLEQARITAACRFVPLGGQRLGVEAEHRLHRALNVALGTGRPQHLPDDAVAPTPRHVRPERMAVAIGEEVGVVEAVDGRHCVPGRRFADPHRSVAVDGTDRQVLGHAFNEPQRQRLQARSNWPALQIDLPRHVVLKGVHQLVTDDVVGLGQPARKGQDDAAFPTLGHATRALADLTVERVGLLEMRMCGVKDELLAAVQLVLQELRQARVPPLSHPRGDADGGFLFWVVVDVEVLAREHLEVEALILDLVAAKVLRSSRDGRTQQNGRNQDSGRANRHKNLGNLIARRGPSPLVSPLQR